MKVIGSLFTVFLFMGTGLMHPQEGGRETKEKGDRMFVGTYTKKEGHVNGKAAGIYLLYRDSEKGTLKFGKTAAEMVNPSFVKESKDGQTLFAVSELGEQDAASGFLYSFKINPDDSLEQIGKASTEGFAPCHIAEDGTGKYVFVSNYLGGIVAVYQRDSKGAAVPMETIALENTKNSHAHSLSFSSNNKHFYIADLGNDRIWIFDFNDSTGEFTANEQAYVELESGAGPRHFTFSKDGRHAYSINELHSSVSVFKVLDGGGLEEVQTVSSLPEEFSDDNAAADIHVHPSGEFLYASNRGHNSIVAYEIKEGKLELIGFTSTKGKTPRNFAIDPSGWFLYVANQDSDSILSFQVNPETGALEQATSKLEVKTPVCLEL